MGIDTQLIQLLNISISYRPGDGLSRLPLPENPKESPIPEELVLLLDTVRTTPITVKQIKQWTDRDPILSSQNLMPERLDGNKRLSPYRERKNELSILDDCVLWGHSWQAKCPGIAT